MRFCICGGCSNSDLLSDHHRFHSFPDRRKVGAGFRAWVHFVQVKRKDFFFTSVTKYSFICAAHFRPEDYVSGDMMEFKMGFRSEKRVRLKAGVIPSIHAAPAAASGSATGGSEDHGPVRDSTIRKRELCTVSFVFWRLLTSYISQHNDLWSVSFIVKQLCCPVKSISLYCKHAKMLASNSILFYETFMKSSSLTVTCLAVNRRLEHKAI